MNQLEDAKKRYDETPVPEELGGIILEAERDGIINGDWEQRQLSLLHLLRR